MCNESQIRKLDTKGILTRFGGLKGGGSNTEPCGEGGPPAKFRFNWVSDLAFGPDGQLFISDAFKLFTIKSVLPNFTAEEIAIPSEDGSEIYKFDANGKHLATIDAITAKNIYTFVYDDAGFLSEVVDRDSNVTVFERDGENNLSAIVGPYGQKTTFILNATDC